MATLKALNTSQVMADLLLFACGLHLGILPHGMPLYWLSIGLTEPLQVFPGKKRW